MFLHFLLEFFLLLANVQRILSGEGRQREEIFQNYVAELSQEEAELILSAQTTFRRYFIQSLTILKMNTEEENSFETVIGEIIEGLLSRALDPLKSFQNGFSPECNRTTAYQVATIVYSLQDCDSKETTFNDWVSFLRTIPNLGDIIPLPPHSHLNPQHIHKANSHKTPFVILVLLAVHHNHLALTETLFQNILLNYRFKYHSPDLDAIVQSLNVSHSLLETDPTAISPDEILSGILESVSRQNDNALAFRTNLLASALSGAQNVAQRTGRHAPWELFTLIVDDDYPPDIVQAATEISAIVKEEVKIDTEVLTGYSPLEQLLSVVAQLTAIPTTHPLSGKILAVYPHVKLRFLSLKQQFFHPRTSSDILFLLNSFSTTPSASLIGEIQKIFLRSRFNWQNILENFDYSKYSRPRTLLLDMVQELAKQSNKFPILTTFLQNNSQVPNCLPHKINEMLSPDTQSTACLKSIEKLNVNIVCKEQLTGEECQENETAVAVVNTDTLVPYAHRMVEKIKSFIIPIDISKKFTKKDVLLNVLSQLEHEEDVTEIEKLRENVLSSVESSEEVDVVYLCVKSNVMKNTQQQTPPQGMLNTHKPSVIFLNPELRHSNVTPAVNNGTRQPGLVMSQVPNFFTATASSTPFTTTSSTSILSLSSASTFTILSTPLSTSSPSITNGSLISTSHSPSNAAILSSLFTTTPFPSLTTFSPPTSTNSTGDHSTTVTLLSSTKLPSEVHSPIISKLLPTSRGP